MKHAKDVHLPDAYLSLICCGALLFLKFIQAIAKLLGNKNETIDNCLWMLSTSRNALIIILAASYAYYLEDPPFDIVGKIPPGIPPFQPPPFTIWNPNTNSTHTFTDILHEEASALVVLPLLAVMGHITIAKAFAGMQNM